VCASISGMSSTLSCTYNTFNGKLFVSNLVTADTTGTSLSFSMTQFINPYNGISESSYLITTGVFNSVNPADPVYAINELATTVTVN
jgi:hypothetical protein